jgi:hypothetical protein
MSLKYTGNSYNRYFEGVRNFLAEEGCDYQWKEIHVAISCQNNLPKLLSKSWDTLETLVLNLYWHSGAILLELESATRLTNLSVSHEIEFSVTYKIPPGLTHLSLNVAAPPKDVVAVLSQCANLEECVINHFFGIWPSEYGITKPPVYLPKLRKLHIRSPFAAKLVEMLKAPVLEDLLLHNGEFKLLHSLLNFIETHKSTLQKFVISMVSDDFISMLEGMENLKELRVFGNAQFEGYMLRALIFKGERVAVGSSGEDGTGEAEDEEAEAEEEVAEDEEAEHEEDEHYSGHAIHLPKLEVLHVICKTQSEIRKAFLEVVRSRSRSSEVARLKSVSLQIGENEQLKRQGFDVTTLDGPLNDEDADWVYGGRKNTDFLEW